MASHYQQFLQVALEAAQAGAEIIKQNWGKPGTLRYKASASDIVTETDTASERHIVEVIRKEFPNHSILAEESGMQTHAQQDHVWAIDPLDGTTNFAHSFPFVAVSIGLMYRGRPIVGVVYNPILHELFCAIHGEGATLNGQKIHVSSITDLSSSLLASGFAYDRTSQPDTNYPEFNHLTHVTQGVRRAGAASLDLAYVAAGRLDGYWERGLKIWDMAAGIVLVEEAGGHVSSYDGSSFAIESGRVLATNGHLHNALIRELEASRSA